MSDFLQKHWMAMIAMLTGSGGVFALMLGWRKPRAETDKLEAETDKIRADADHLAWQHMKETVERLDHDVNNLKMARDDAVAQREKRDKQIARLQRSLAARAREGKQCLERERILIKRVKALEDAQPK